MLIENSEEAATNYTLVLGRVHDQIGGPTRTIWGYVQGLSSIGKTSTIAGLGTDTALEASFGEAHASALIAIDGSIISKTLQLIRLYGDRRTSPAIIVVGVWHLSFFTLGICNILASAFMVKSRPKILLIPTMSLTMYDWKKHKIAKSALRTLVWAILRKLDGIVFASTGELESSQPAAWRRSKVVLHPSISIDDSVPSLTKTRDIDVLFVGRLDRQKDLPLLLKSFSLLGSPYNLHIVGAGEAAYVSELVRLAEELGISHRIYWHGWKSHAETLNFLRRSKVVAVTSIIENFCHVAVEALVSESNLVLVDRVMSAKDFAEFADIDVTKPDAHQLAYCLNSRLSSWERDNMTRHNSARATRRACGPEYAASKLDSFMWAENRVTSVAVDR